MAVPQSMETLAIEQRFTKKKHQSRKTTETDKMAQVNKDH